jgi:hypothetical protein
MTQESKLRAESRKSGFKYSFDLGVLAAKALSQYERDSTTIRNINRNYGYMNLISVINNSNVQLAIDLDFSSQKRIVIPASSAITRDLENFQEFNVINLSTTTATAANEVNITIGYERSLLRESG